MDIFHGKLLSFRVTWHLWHWGWLDGPRGRCRSTQRGLGFFGFRGENIRPKGWLGVRCRHGNGTQTRLKHTTGLIFRFILVKNFRGVLHVARPCMDPPKMEYKLKRWCSNNSSVISDSILTLEVLVAKGTRCFGTLVLSYCGHICWLRIPEITNQPIDLWCWY